MTDTANQTAPATKTKPLLDAELIRAGEYTLGLLSPIEAARFAQEVREKPALAAKYADWVKTLSTLTAGRDVQPPEHLLRMIEARLFPGEVNPPKSNALSWLAQGALVAVALVALVGAMLVLRG